MRRIAKGIGLVPIMALCWLWRVGWLRYEIGSFVLATVPGFLGVWLRRLWYQRTLRRCGQRLTLNWLAYIYTPDTCLGNDVYIGPYSAVMSADIGDDVMLATRVTVARGSHRHGFARLDIPMTRQPGQPRQVRIGSDVWIGTGAVIITDVAPGTIVGA